MAALTRHANAVCSFCGNTGDVVGVEGRDARVCRACSELMASLLRDVVAGRGRDENWSLARAHPASRALLEAFACSFCGAERDQVFQIFPAAGGRAFLCDRCVVQALGTLAE